MDEDVNGPYILFRESEAEKADLRQALEIANGIIASENRQSDILMDGLRGAIAERDKAVADLAALRQAQTWRPIEEAPKDGTGILVCFVSGHISILYWNVEEESWKQEDETIQPMRYATHFMLLPAPPAQKEG